MTTPSEPMSDECSCTGTTDCARCARLFSAGDRWIDANGTLGLGQLLEERERLRAEAERLKLAVQSALEHLEAHEKVLKDRNAALEKERDALRGALEEARSIANRQGHAGIYLALTLALREKGEGEG